MFEDTEAGGRTLLERAHSVFADIPQHAAQRLQFLSRSTGADIALAPLGNGKVQAKVSSGCSHLTGPMHGIEAVVTARPADRVLRTERQNSIFSIIDAQDGA